MAEPDGLREKRQPGCRALLSMHQSCSLGCHPPAWSWEHSPEPGREHCFQHSSVGGDLCSIFREPIRLRKEVVSLPLCLSASLVGVGIDSGS